MRNTNLNPLIAMFRGMPTARLERDHRLALRDGTVEKQAAIELVMQERNLKLWLPHATIKKVG